MNPSALDFRNVNTLWCSVMAATLARCGVRHAVISPGSRSAALTMALVRHPEIETTPVLDERSAAFFALGLAKRLHAPVVLVCTSGTAGANYFPAVIEASESGVPLVVITADRPPELRDCASGQTIDQQKLFGGFVRFYHELAVPEATEPMLRYLRQTVRHAARLATGPDGGPVHLNAPFRDPLAPQEDGTALLLRGAIDEGLFFAGVGDGAEQVVGKKISFHDLPATDRGLIVAGPAQPADVEEYCRAVGQIARQLGWPVLAEGLSPVRNHAGKIPHLVTRYDAILRSEKAAELLRPEFVLCLEGWPISKVLRAWLGRIAPPVHLVSADRRNRDALHGCTRHVVCDIPAYAAGLPSREAEETEYLQQWRAAGSAAEKALGKLPEGFEGKIARVLPELLPEETPVFIASSMPVRDVEYFWPANDRRIRPFFNRGANGIDGTLSTALGIAHGGRPAVLLTGDLALLHDANGFLSAPRLRGSLTVVLINNRGGGIFEHLPVAAFDPPFEEYFATPQEVDFANLCAAHAVAHTLVRDGTHLRELLAEWPAQGVRVLEVRTDRKRDAATRRQLFSAAAAAVDAALAD